MANIVKIIFLSLIFANKEFCKLQCSSKTLALLNIVFRHGNKTQEGTYPTDPYKNETYYPIGHGQLTNGGHVLGYETGKYLRKRYSKFLGNYSNDVLEAYSSPSPRCKDYLELILAGLYPPSEHLRWHPTLNWQPIPFNNNCTLPKKLFWPMRDCPNFSKMYQEYKKGDEYTKAMAQYQKTINFLVEKTGLDEKTVRESHPAAGLFGVPMFLHATLLSQHEWGLQLPNWIEGIWPDLLTEMVAAEWKQVFRQEEMQIIAAGDIMSKLINDMYLTIHQDTSVKKRKLNLYVGHDSNIYPILAWLNVHNSNIYAYYGSYIIFELHNVKGEYYIQILFQNLHSAAPVRIEIPHCGYCCPIDDFMRLYSSKLNAKKQCE